MLARTGPRPGPGITAAWTPDGTEIVTDGAGPSVWEATTGREVGTVQTGAPVADVTFSRDGTRLAMTTVDETSSTRVWDWPREAELLKLAGGALWVDFSPDGTLLAGVDNEPTPYVKVWALDVDRLLQIARGRVTRSLTDARVPAVPPARLPEGLSRRRHQRTTWLKGPGGCT